eukprot:TRINITY_DN9474_c0_g1_i1.p2 TRINITY_DN9474_c0_g1~~TRINITY_DN9474_c0_g1_i1.p2  ORF type:complete len:408 (-),score=101.59 TRINITY_DN9474_c0_g1_i1:145-1368(-)
MMVRQYSKELREQDASGKPISTTLLNSIKAVSRPPLAYHNRIVSRYWLSLLTCFVFAVFIDNYSPSCAITAVFLINTRVGPDVMAMINGLLSVVVGIVMNALMYSFSCKYGNTAVLMVVSVFYWASTIFVAFGGSSLAGIGLIMAALAPFAILKQCAASTPAGEAASAVGLWGGIRALLIAVLVTVLWEVAHVPGSFTKMSSAALNDAFEAVQKAFDEVFAENDVTEALAKVASNLGDAETYSSAAIMEPRLWKCKWQKDFLAETSGTLNKVRLDILVMRLALLGGSEEVPQDGSVVKHLNELPECKQMQDDLTTTLKDAQTLAIKLLQHERGDFHGLDGLSSLEGLATLAGMDEALDGLNKRMTFPRKAPASIEEDELAQLSIVFVMLQYIIGHVADIIKAGVKLA